MRKRILMLLALQLPGFCLLTVAYNVNNTTHNKASIKNTNKISATVIRHKKSSTRTADFTIQSTRVVITQPDCNRLTGSITGLVIVNSDPLPPTFSWKNATGAEVAKTLDLKNISDGTYTLTATSADKSFAHTYGPVTLVSIPAPRIDASRIVITQSICGQATGSIKNITASGAPGALPLDYLWVDSQGNMVGTTLDVDQLQSGMYTLNVLNKSHFCGAIYGPVTILNTGGPTIDLSKMIIYQANCYDNNAYIKRITATGVGALDYEWTNLTGRVMGTDLDVDNLSQGTYRLKVTDQSGCGPTFSKPITVVKRTEYIAAGVTVVTKATCTTNASVKGLIGDSDLLYTWTDADGNIVGTDAELLDVDGGIYTLTITTLCQAPLDKITNLVFDLGPKHIILSDYMVTLKNTCLNESSGSIKVDIDNKIKSCYWLNSNNTIIGTTAQITGLMPGNYRFYVTDIHDCEKLYQTYTIVGATPVSIVSGSETITNDQCNAKVGGVTNIKITGGVEPYIYTWTNTKGDTVSTSLNLTDAGAGLYTLTVNDAGTCIFPSKSYTVTNSYKAIEPPVIKDVSNCDGGDITLAVSNVKDKHVYRLYESPTSPTSLYSEVDGKFKLSLVSTKHFYAVAAFGDCESERVPVTVNVNIALKAIPNVITPNGDGFNDFWKIPGIEKYPKATVMIYSRNGQKVFESVGGYDSTFNGTFNGRYLSSGTYYYLIDLHIGCSLLTGSVTIIR